jgi:Prenyltransferase and squalene oxidase repeat
MQADFQPGRRRFLLRSAALGAGLAFGLEGRANQDAEPTPESDLRDFVTAETQRAIDRGLVYLSGTQNRDGSFGERFQWHGNVAVTSLAGLAMMSGGHTPGRGVCGANVQRTVQYILSRESNDTPGYLHHSGSSRQVGMYDHGFATLFLAEVYGMIPDRALQEHVRRTIEKAVRLIETSQNPEGGWRYDPSPNQADVSVTICQIMALRAARNAGFFVNHDTVKKCLKYVRSCQNPDGGYTYFSGNSGSAFARSAAGIVALYSAGVYDGKEIERTLKYLSQFKPNLPLSRREIPEMHWYYGQYYAAQAMWTAAARYPQYWNDWYPAIRDELLARCRGRVDGSWTDSMTCNHYATAMALIILQIPNNYLPILQK